LVHQHASDVAIYDAMLVASELVSNAIRHASPLANDTMLVRWRREGDDLVVAVCDGGGAGDPVLVVADPTDERGRGLAIVDALSEHWWVQRSNKVHTVHVRLPLF
jgi:anti-sigma regulatory factor (Ser/Thr protein kinase)